MLTLAVCGLLGFVIVWRIEGEATFAWFGGIVGLMIGLMAGGLLGLAFPDECMTARYGDGVTASVEALGYAKAIGPNGKPAIGVVNGAEWTVKRCVDRPSAGIGRWLVLFAGETVEIGVPVGTAAVEGQPR